MPYETVGLHFTMVDEPPCAEPHAGWCGGWGRKTPGYPIIMCPWCLPQHLTLVICGPTGVGKSYLACALAHKACLEGYTALYLRLPRLFEDLRLAKADGRYGKLMLSYSKTDLLVLDDWGLTPMTDPQRRDLLELLEDRYGRKSTIVTSQLPVTSWHEAIGDPTLADAILDRIVHNAHKIELKGESMRKHAIMLDQN